MPEPDRGHVLDTRHGVGTDPEGRRMRTQPVTGPTTAWGGLQRRVRRLVPRPIRRADLAVFRALARTEVPVLGPLLPRLSRAANHSRLWMAIASLLALVGGRFGRRAAARGMLAVGITSAVTNLPAKLLTGRVRPDLTVVPEIRRLAAVPASTSFPSGHSASAFAFATGASLEEPRLRPVLFPLAAAVAVSRVYTGVHYPGDVLVGSAMGVAVARATRRTWPLADDRPATATRVEREAGDVEQDGTGVVLVANVGAGSVLSEAQVDRMRAALPGMRTIEAQPDEELPGTLRRAAAAARVLAVAGGDGTASAGAAAAHEAGIPLLVVPSGTLNHLAKDLGIEDVEDAVAAVRSGRTIRADLGEVDGRLFVNAVSLGSYPDLVDTRARLEERMGKWPAMVWGTLRNLRDTEPIEVEIDGRRRRVWLLFVGNGGHVAEGIAPTRRRQLDDGVLDVRLVHAEKPFARTRVLLSMLTGRLGRCAVHERRQTDEVRVRSRHGPLRLASDGESWDGPAEFVIRKRKRALLLLQPDHPTFQG